jgi:hypothetical protein
MAALGLIRPPENSVHVGMSENQRQLRPVEKVLLDYDGDGQGLVTDGVE